MNVFARRFALLLVVLAAGMAHAQQLKVAAVMKVGAGVLADLTDGDKSVRVYLRPFMADQNCVGVMKVGDSILVHEGGELTMKFVHEDSGTICAGPTEWPLTVVGVGNVQTYPVKRKVWRKGTPYRPENIEVRLLTYQEVIVKLFDRTFSILVAPAFSPISETHPDATNCTFKRGDRLTISGIHGLALSKNEDGFLHRLSASYDECGFSQKLPGLFPEKTKE